MSDPTPSQLKTPQEWSALDGVRILDPDGWREVDAPPFDQPITHEEFIHRLRICTIQRLAPSGLALEQENPNG